MYFFSRNVSIFLISDPQMKLIKLVNGKDVSYFEATRNSTVEWIVKIATLVPYLEPYLQW